MNLRRILFIILGVTTISAVAYYTYLGIIPSLWVKRLVIIALVLSLIVAITMVLNQFGVFNHISNHRGKVIFAILTALVIATLACAIGFSITPWFWIYWLFIIALVATLIFCALRYEAVADIAGNLAGHLYKDNNWRLGALAILAIVFTISAMLAGFGRPLLISSTVETKNVVIEQAERHRIDIRAEMNYIFTGNRTQPMKVAGKKYSSWWHWIWAIFLWISTIVYLPFAFADEAKHALREAIKLVEKRKNRESIRTGSVSTATPVSTPRIVFKDSFMRLFSIDILAEYVPIFISKIMKRIVSI